LKTHPKELLGSLPLNHALPDSIHWNISDWIESNWKEGERKEFLVFKKNVTKRKKVPGCFAKSILYKLTEYMTFRF
jgi:hypothetical protein